MSPVTHLEVPVYDTSLVTVGNGVKNLTEFLARISLGKTAMTSYDIYKHSAMTSLNSR